MNKIAAECCGSCDKYVNCHCQLFGHKHEVQASCDSYTPRNPIENPYKKMWEELKAWHKKAYPWDENTSRKMNQLEKENNLD